MGTGAKLQAASKPTGIYPSNCTFTYFYTAYWLRRGGLVNAELVRIFYAKAQNITKAQILVDLKEIFSIYFFELKMLKLVKIVANGNNKVCIGSLF
jgi:hypothetical protein